MPQVYLKIEIPAELEPMLKAAIKRRTIEQCITQRMQVIYLSKEGYKVKDIVKEVGLNAKTINTWRNYWKERVASIQVSPDDLRDANRQLQTKLYEAFCDKPRSGSPARITESEIARLIALACELPENYGYPVSKWTLNLLSCQAKKMNIEISPAHYGRVLKKRLTSA